jgi:hypothetical protein
MAFWKTSNTFCSDLVSSLKVALDLSNAHPLLESEDALELHDI